MRVLYICTGNSFRSPAAEALTRKFHPDLEVESAGTDAVDHIAENMRHLLEEEDAGQFVKPSPDQVSQRAIDEADRIVCMMPEHQRFLVHNFEIRPEDIEVWSIADPIHLGVSPKGAFDKIAQKVREINP